MSTTASRLAASFAMGATVALWFGCSSTPPAAVCDSSTCLQGNTCITGFATYEDEQNNTPDTKCRLQCSAPEDCPFDYHCVAGGKMQDGGGDASYCEKDKKEDFLPGDGYFTKGPGVWGDKCDPTKGFDQNPDCDTGQSFWCYGTSPTDGNSYCTQYQCGDDSDCPGGWWCATVNDTPSVTAVKRAVPGGWGADHTTSVCMPRVYNVNPGTYCSPCKSDLDCPLNTGIKQHCATTDQGDQVCAVECQSDNNCPFDQHCGSVDGIDSNVCLPNAGTCKPTGDFCSPCTSDKDCGGGFCVQADYSTEHFCTAPSGTTCKVVNNALQSTCPGAVTGGAGVTCSYNALFTFPLNQCVGLYNFGSGANANKVFGCWTRAH